MPRGFYLDATHQAFFRKPEPRRPDASEWVTRVVVVLPWMAWRHHLWHESASMVRVEWSSHRAIRDELLRVPGEVLVRRTADGWLMSAAESSGTVLDGQDGLPVLSIGRPVTTAEVLDAIDQERAER